MLFLMMKTGIFIYQIADSIVNDGIRIHIELEWRISTDKNIDRCPKVHLKFVKTILINLYSVYIVNLKQNMSHAKVLLVA